LPTTIKTSWRKIETRRFKSEIFRQPFPARHLVNFRGQETLENLDRARPKLNLKVKEHWGCSNIPAERLLGWRFVTSAGLFGSTWISNCQIGAALLPFQHWNPRAARQANQSIDRTKAMQRNASITAWLVRGAQRAGSPNNDGSPTSVVFSGFRIAVYRVGRRPPP
jgi:hypothetical protein